MRSERYEKGKSKKDINIREPRIEKSISAKSQKKITENTHALLTAYYSITSFHSQLSSTATP